MVSLAPELRAKAQVYSSMTGMPEWNPFDERYVVLPSSRISTLI